MFQERRRLAADWSACFTRRLERGFSYPRSSRLGLGNVKMVRARARGPRTRLSPSGDCSGFSGEPHQLVDVIELLYETETGDAVVLRMRNESTGFGSRAAGRQLRTKCMNLLNAEPTKPLFLDWTGVPLVSSGFADELVGKLFVTLGPLAFSARVRNLGMDAVVGGLVDKAILQRAAQVANGTVVPNDIG